MLSLNIEKGSYFVAAHLAYRTWNKAGDTAKDVNCIYLEHSITFGHNYVFLIFEEGLHLFGLANMLVQICALRYKYMYTLQIGINLSLQSFCDNIVAQAFKSVWKLEI